MWIGLGLLGVGFAVFTAALVWDAQPSSIPNDPNIGAGLVALVGVWIAISGAAAEVVAITRRRSSNRKAR